jgi:hypothetical protein
MDIIDTLFTGKRKGPAGSMSEESKRRHHVRRYQRVPDRPRFIRRNVRMDLDPVCRFPGALLSMKYRHVERNIALGGIYAVVLGVLYALAALLNLPLP